MVPPNTGALKIGSTTDVPMDVHVLIYFLNLFVTEFAKRGLPHTFNLLISTTHNFKYLKAMDLKFGQFTALT